MNSTHITEWINTQGIQQKLIEKRLKNSGQAPFIAKPSKVLKNSSGVKLEISQSLDFHSEGTPLLVSPKLLRERDLGQIDLARMKKDREGWLIEIAEVKSSDIGVENILRGQRRRLFSAQNFLSGVFGFRSRFIRLVG